MSSLISSDGLISATALNLPLQATPPKLESADANFGAIWNNALEATGGTPETLAVQPDNASFGSNLLTGVVAHGYEQGAPNVLTDGIATTRSTVREADVNSTDSSLTGLNLATWLPLDLRGSLCEPSVSRDAKQTLTTPVPIDRPSNRGTLNQVIAADVPPAVETSESPSTLIVEVPQSSTESALTTKATPSVEIEKVRLPVAEAFRPEPTSEKSQSKLETKEPTSEQPSLAFVKEEAVTDENPSTSSARQTISAQADLIAPTPDAAYKGKSNALDDGKRAYQGSRAAEASKQCRSGAKEQTCDGANAISQKVPDEQSKDFQTSEKVTTTAQNYVVVEQPTPVDLPPVFVNFTPEKIPVPVDRTSKEDIETTESSGSSDSVSSERPTVLTDRRSVESMVYRQGAVPSLARSSLETHAGSAGETAASNTVLPASPKMVGREGENIPARRSDRMVQSEVATTLQSLPTRRLGVDTIPQQQVRKSESTREANLTVLSGPTIQDTRVGSDLNTTAEEISLDSEADPETLETHLAPPQIERRRTVSKEPSPLPVESKVSTTARPIESSRIANELPGSLVGNALPAKYQTTNRGEQAVSTASPTEIALPGGRSEDEVSHYVPSLTRSGEVKSIDSEPDSNQQLGQRTELSRTVPEKGRAVNSNQKEVVEAFKGEIQSADEEGQPQTIEGRRVGAEDLRGISFEKNDDRPSPLNQPAKPASSSKKVIDGASIAASLSSNEPKPRNVSIAREVVLAETFVKVDKGAKEELSSAELTPELGNTQKTKTEGPSIQSLPAAKTTRGRVIDEEGSKNSEGSREIEQETKQAPFVNKPSASNFRATSALPTTEVPRRPDEREPAGLPRPTGLPPQSEENSVSASWKTARSDAFADLPPISSLNRSENQPQNANSGESLVVHATRDSANLVSVSREGTVIQSNQTGSVIAEEPSSTALTENKSEKLTRKEKGIEATTETLSQRPIELVNKQPREKLAAKPIEKWSDEPVGESSRRPVGDYDVFPAKEVRDENGSKSSQPTESPTFSVRVREVGIPRENLVANVLRQPAVEEVVIHDSKTAQVENFPIAVKLASGESALPHLVGKRLETEEERRSEIISTKSSTMQWLASGSASESQGNQVAPNATTEPTWVPSRGALTTSQGEEKLREASGQESRQEFPVSVRQEKSAVAGQGEYFSDHSQKSKGLEDANPGVPASEGDRPKRLSISSENSRGTSVAQTGSEMKRAAKRYEIARPDQQELPAEAISTSSSRSREVEVPVGFRHELSNSVAEKDLSEIATVRRSDGVDSASDEWHSHMPIHDRVLKLIQSEVDVLNSNKAERLSVVLRPDEQTEIVLKLKCQQGHIEAQAQCERGDYDTLNSGWGKLQETLSACGVKLAPLNSTANHDSGWLSSQQNRTESNLNFNQQRNPQDTPRTFERELLMPRTSESTTTSPRRPRAAVSDRLLESWA